MKGISGGISLFIATIGFLAIITIVSVAFLGFFSSETYEDTCRKDTINQVNSWMEKMSVPAAGNFNDEFRIGGCVEYVHNDGIKFREEENVIKFKTLNGPSIEFDLSETSKERILSRDDPYSVTLISPITVKINSE